MFDDKVILCGSSSYEKIFYFNPEFDSLPKQIKDELQIMCVLFTEDVGGILRLEFDEKGNLNLTVESKEDDFFFDEIGSVLKIKQLRAEKRELLENMELSHIAPLSLAEQADALCDQEQGLIWLHARDMHNFIAHCIYSDDGFWGFVVDEPGI